MQCTGHRVQPEAPSHLKDRKPSDWHLVMGIPAGTFNVNMRQDLLCKYLQAAHIVCTSLTLMAKSMSPTGRALGQHTEPQHANLGLPKDSSRPRAQQIGDQNCMRTSKAGSMQKSCQQRPRVHPNSSTGLLSLASPHPRFSYGEGSPDFVQGQWNHIWNSGATPPSPIPL